MGKEIERKFIVSGDAYKSLAKGVLYRQGYLSSDMGKSVRVRVFNDRGYLTVKGPSMGATRLEYEYEIPANEANEMLEYLCERPIIEKFRYKFQFEGFTWEIDEFLGENEGLIIAEIELPDENTVFKKPDWVGREVTGDPKYLNSNLIKNPYKNFKE